MLEIDEMNASVVLADVVKVVPTRGSAEKQHKKRKRATRPWESLPGDREMTQV